jgi:hypothetical protein
MGRCTQYTGRRTSGASTINDASCSIIEPQSRTYFNKNHRNLRAFQLKRTHSKDETINFIKSCALWLKYRRHKICFYFGENSSEVARCIEFGGGDGFWQFQIVLQVCVWVSIMILLLKERKIVG